MSVTIKLRRGTTAQWSSANPTLALGEVGIDTDLNQFKVGDGATAWSSLAYATAPINSPAFTGTPTAPTANAGTNTTQIATTAFVSTAISNLINGAPGALDTLDELAQALGDDSNFATTITNSLASKQPLDADLTAIAGLSGTSGLLKKTAADTWSLDTNTYLTGNQNITISGDATGSGTTSISLTLANSGVSANTYGSSTAIPVITVNAKGIITGVTTSSVEGLPSQTGNSGKYLTTDGTTASWSSVEAGFNPFMLMGA